MKKESKPRNMILKFLPKAVSAVASVGFQNPPFSPSRDKRITRTSAGKGLLLPGPMVSIIPDSKAESFETQEPTSPKVSCIGKIKHKKNIKKAKRNLKAVSESTHKSSSHGEVKKDLGDYDSAPYLGQVRRFTSGRDGLAGVDWTAKIAAAVEADQRGDDYSDEEGRSEHSDLEDEEEVMFPFSGAMAVGGGGLALQPRKEINIWKRRTVNQPTPLLL
ncbi:hypothetical protein like AT1G76070 [Hibiscus trionum]|uniref:Syringolide-induced protein 14-1-1 n=1 Tax=Hibiscus trionum TaxID=183268 RepID=A0A9W7HTF5_HIBTR|nr:hypothetical protein like AT1G76070 [Hibiscus trionum]